MWDYLKGRYVQNSGALLLTLMQGLHELQRNEMSIEEYYTAFDRVMGPFLSMVPKSRGRGAGSTPKGSVSVAAASPVSAPSSSWVLDSEASFHVTSDQSQLVAFKPIADGASIQTADGSSHRDCTWDWPSP
ncbi:unnamed protein product [Miscanthus lutarioriparius]|uniref:Uncharacterized protein n=1 Tax=Miscanthus lutarioriparius TaxID=422564 RepID=A0A811QCC5_9POAL|nr:unnamed protein product [Miscanthus lutarioriparius]